MAPSRLALVPVLAAGLAAGDVAPPAAAAAVDIPVRRVVLFSSGVGYIEHAGAVDGAATATLRFTAPQLSDVLKSLLIEDLDGGSVGSVAYPSQAPLERQLKSFRIDITGNPSLARMLEQLRGAGVSVSAQAERLSGTILGTETRTVPLGTPPQPTQVAYLNLLVAGAIRSIPLDSIASLTLDDSRLQEELGKALAALAEARDQDKKPVQVAFAGQGQRRVRLGYVVETPVWKTSWRLVLPGKPGDAGRLQGWAIVENQTDADWTNIDLRLVAGRPISFIQDLARPLFLQRPVVQPEVSGSLRPVAYAGGAALADKEEEKGALRNRLDRRAAGKAMAPAAPAAAMMAGEAAATDAWMGAPMDPTAGFQAVAATEKLGEQFQYAVPAVSLPRQRSAMLPIVQAGIAAERVSIYNRNVHAVHPLSGAWLTNTTGQHLQQGPVTVLDAGGYAGDARIDDVAPGQRRLLSFAMDLPVRVGLAGEDQQRTVASGILVKGALELRTSWVVATTYRIRNEADAERLVVVEHPGRRDWQLVDTPEPRERSGDLLRFAVPVAAGKDATLTVKESQVQGETVIIGDLDADAIVGYAATGVLPARVREALTRAAQLKRAEADARRARELKQQEIQAVVADQGRLRENLRSVQQNSPFYQRTLGKLDEQETKLEALRGESERLGREAEARRQELADYLAGLDLR